MPNVAVVGASGYLGGEILRLLTFHPELELSAAVSASQPGTPLAELLPNLVRFGTMATSADCARLDADLAFLAQPAGEAMKLVPGLLERGIKVVDLGPDYRLPTSELYRSTYGAPHLDAGHLAEAVYGLPELFGDRIGPARLVANPGCYPTATLLALVPLLRAGEVGGPVIVDAKSGSSGAGQAPSPSTHYAEAALTVHPYGTPTHRHVPEMRAVLGGLLDVVPPIVFVPHLVPLVRGILCSIYPTPSGGADPAHWADALRAAYQGSRFVHVGGTPRLPWAAGTNHCFLSVQSAEGMPVLFSALDNLGKGGAAQAVQNANLMLGLRPEAGLDFAGFAV